MKLSLKSRVEGLLLGTAVADSIGLPTEGMTPAVIGKLGWARSLKHRFLFGRGMWSDDTEQMIMLSQALLSSGGDVEKFTRSFAWELRWWILGLPAATGLATARAIIKLWVGISPSRSGVWSAGNGSAMRTAPIAAYFPEDASKRRIFTLAQCRVTHSDPKAFIASLAITELCHLFLKAEQAPSAEEVLETVRGVSDDPEWREIVEKIKMATGVPELLLSLETSPQKGISGYVYHTVPAVIFLGIQNHWDFRNTVTSLIKAGGDTDTTAAIAGALCGALGGRDAIPDEWILKIQEWPVSASRLTSLGESIVNQTPLRIRPRWSVLLVSRNLIFLAVVLFHGFSRLLPCSVRARGSS